QRQLVDPGCVRWDWENDTPRAMDILLQPPNGREEFPSRRTARNAGRHHNAREGSAATAGRRVWTLPPSPARRKEIRTSPTGSRVPSVATMLDRLRVCCPRRIHHGGRNRRKCCLRSSANGAENRRETSANQV